MLIHEQFYTSAPKLLDSTSSNLGVVAQTHGFPKEVEGDLDSHRSYTLRSEDIRDTASCPPRFAIAVCGRQSSHVVISRVSFAGADHTGRTSPFAHHLAIRCDEMERNGVDLASVVNFATRALRDRWDGPPTWLDPRSWDEGMSLRSNQVSPAWKELLPADGINSLLANLADALVADPTSRQPVVICMPPGGAHAALEMCADVLRLLPAKVQAGCVCVSHVVEMADYLRDSAFVFTYPETPFVFQSRQRQDVRRPLIFDLYNCGLSSHPTGPYAEALLSVAHGASIDPTRSVARFWDECGLTPAHKSIFPLALRLREHLAATPAAGDVTVVASELEALSNTQPLRAHVEEWSMTFLQGLLKLPIALRWASVNELACDGRWPERIRSAAFDELARQAESSLPYTLSHGSATDGEHDVATREMGRRVGSFPAVASTAVRLAITQPTERHLRFAAVAIACGKPTFASTLQWWDEIGTGVEAVQRALQSALISQLARTCRSGEDFAALRERTKSENPCAQFNRDVYREVLRSHFSASPSDKVRGTLADLLMSASLQEPAQDACAKELVTLLGIHRSAITVQHVENWLQRARGTAQEAPLKRVAAEAGVLSVAAPPVPEPPRFHEPEAHHPAPFTPAFGEADLRPKPMRVGRARGVLPRGALHTLLFVLLVGITALWIVDYFQSKRIWPRDFWYFVGLATVGFASWLVSVLMDLAVSSRPDQLGLAFGVRKVMAVALIILLCVLTWRAWDCLSKRDTQAVQSKHRMLHSAQIS